MQIRFSDLMSSKTNSGLSHITHIFSAQRSLTSPCFTSLSFAFCFSFALTGCASIIGANSPDWPWTGTSACRAAACDAKEAMDAFNAASDYCRRVQNYYEAGGQKANSNKVAIATAGTLAGSVIAPIANGTAAKAWSGLSGATNALQATMDEAFSASVSIKRRAAVVSAAQQGFKNYKSSGTDSNGQVIAAINMASECSMSSARADLHTLRVLSDDTPPLIAASGVPIVP